MAADSASIAADDYLHRVLRAEIYRVCNATGDNSAYSSCPYGSHKAHEDLLLTCIGCKRDTTELKRAMKARDDAEVYLKHVTNMETSYLRQAVDTHKIRPKEEDLT